jgi:DNA-binding transcriptional MocR family regulator
MNEKGLNIKAEDVLITSGSQQGIDLTAKAFLNKGDKVLLENPTYLAAIQICKTYEAEFSPVLSDEQGMLPQNLAKALQENPEKNKIAYLIPTFQNPAGTTMGSERRKEIMELLVKEEITIVEDNPYGELNYSGEEFPLLKSFDKEGQVIYLGSFSKIISPGLRVGFAIASPEVMSKLVIGKQAADVHVSNLSQEIIYEFCNRGYLKPHIEMIKDKYKKKKDLMLECLKKYMPEGVSWIEPQGGLFIWTSLPEGYSGLELFKRAVDKGVAFVPGASFFACGGGENTMRLNFSNSTPEEVEKGCEILGDTIKKFLSER